MGNNRKHHRKLVSSIRPGLSHNDPASAEAAKYLILMFISAHPPM